MNKEKFSNPKSVIEEANNQFSRFNFFKYSQIEKIKEVIKKAEFKTLEQQTNFSKEELEKIKPGICEKYDSLITELQDENLTLEKFKEILKESWDLTHSF